MADRNWDQEYVRILERAQSAGQTGGQPSGSERRRHPRFSLNHAEILVTEQLPHQIVDLSISGLSFFASREFPAGHHLMLSLRQILAIEAEVVGCDALSGPDAPAPFRVRCRLADPDYGLRFLVLAMEMESEGQA